jgi:2-hydroxychromene-2-carboxylate isomerase
VTKLVEFFFDYSCPYAYLASTQIEALCQRNGAALRWRPMLLGGIFQALQAPQNMAGAMSPAKALHNQADMMRWASLWEVPLSMPNQHPMRTVEALRATLAVPEAARAPVIHSLFRAYWVENHDITQTEVIRAALDRAGQDGAAVLARVGAAEKDALRQSTDEALSRGVFGAPSVFVGDELFWGQDRLGFVEAALGGTPQSPGQGRFSRSTPAPEVECYFDFSSPFAYLGATQLEALCHKHGAPLRWRPMLLGAVFKSIKGPDIPLSTFSPAKQAYYAKDLARWAAHWKVPFQWPSRFPMRTLKPLRLLFALEGKPEYSAFLQACYRAYWAEDQDIDSDDTLKALLSRVGLPEETLRAADDPANKQALLDATNRAVQAGVFGAPALVVEGRLFWGQDRLALVERALEGWKPEA